MSKGNPQAGGSTSGFGSQGQFGTGYTQPYGAPGTGTYDPMLGFGQASGMGTTYDYPTRYSADYTRYAQSGMPFNQPVMGYNTYGQIFAQPQRPPPTMGKGGGGFRPQPPPIMGGGKGGGGFQPGYGYQPQFPGMMAGGPGFPQQFPRLPERRTNQLGLNQPPPQNLNNVPEPGPQGLPSPLVPIKGQSYTGGFGNSVPSPPFGGFGSNVPEPEPGSDREFRSYPGGSTPTGGVGQSLPPDISGSPFGQLIGGGLGGMGGTPLRTEDFVRPIFNQLEPQPHNRPIGGGLGGMPTGGPQIDPNYTPVMGAKNFDILPTVAPDNYIPRFGNMMYFQEGGQVPPDANMEMMLSEAGPANPQSEMAGEYDRLIQMTMQAILGQVENPDEVIQMFIDEFGVDAFRQLRDAVLKQQVPNAQTEGMVDGNGGGMDDQVMGMIGNQRPVAVSPGEYIVPADVVSGLGDGSSKSGADILDELNQAVRMARTGTTQQPRPLMVPVRAMRTA